jgi:hypothetical protein
MEGVQTRKMWFVRLTDLTLSCAAGPACRSRSGAPVAANDVRRIEWRTATGVTPSRLGQGRQLGCRAEAGPHQLQREVSQRFSRGSLTNINHLLSLPLQADRPCQTVRRER